MTQAEAQERALQILEGWPGKAYLSTTPYLSDLRMIVMDAVICGIQAEKGVRFTVRTEEPKWWDIF